MNYVRSNGRKRVSFDTSMQTRFSKTVWQNEVKKMVDAYGAPISEADQALIVEYLVALKGVEAPAAATPPSK